MLMHHLLNIEQIRTVVETICGERLGKISRWAAKKHAKEDILLIWHMVAVVI